LIGGKAFYMEDIEGTNGRFFLHQGQLSTH
jgi:hypothetical protein